VKGKLQITPREQHDISRRNISPSALKVMNRLNQAGYEGYLVGGGVRDLLLDSSPKDFDVATNATPEQIKATFRNSRIIGRRFKIVHVRFGQEIIEVTTFRGQNSESSQHVESDTGQLLRDNVYGDMESDALRRDFTANALYYSSKDFALYDFTTGLSDIAKRQLRMIGDPTTRYTEDPVRLLRAVRFAAKLGFSIEPATEAPIREQAHLLSHVPPARLFDEILKLLLNGCATATYSLLTDHGLFKELFPDTHSALIHSPYYRPLIDEVMLNTDKRIRSDKRVTPAFIYAAILWPAMHHRLEELKINGMSEFDAINDASQSIVSRQLQRIMIPKRFLIPMRQIWELQWRLPNRNGKRAYRLLEHPKFRAGFDFLLAREAAGEQLDGLGQWWEQFQHANEDLKAKMVNELNPSAPRKKRRRKNPTKRNDPQPNQP
jgi:poly(A) polymerase